MDSTEFAAVLNELTEKVNDNSILKIAMDRGFTAPEMYNLVGQAIVITDQRRLIKRVQNVEIAIYWFIGKRPLNDPPDDKWIAEMEARLAELPDYKPMLG